MGELVKTPVRFALHLALARLLTQWRSLLTIIAGTILAASIGALVPLYTTAVSQVGMTQRLAEEDARDVHVQANISLRASGWLEDGGLRDKAAQSTLLVERIAERDLSAIDNWVDEIIGVVETEAMGFSQVMPDTEELVPLVGARTHLAYYADWQNRVRVVAGRLPDDNPADVDMEIVVGLNVANELNLEPDSLVVLDQGMNQRGSTGGGHPTSQTITARIVGVVSPLDEESPYWMEPSPLRLIDKQSGAGLWDYEFSFLTTEEAVFTAATDYLPDTPTKIGWRVLFAHDNLPFSRIDPAREALVIFAGNIQDIFTIEAPVEETNSQSSGRQDLAFNYHTRLIDYDIIRRDRDNGILLDYAQE